MQRSHLRLFGMTALFCVATVVIARADEEKVPLNKVPKAIMKAVKAKFPDAKIKGASKETEDGKTEYEIVLTNNDEKIDVIVTPEGKITTLEKGILVKDLPKAVTDALETKYPQSTCKSAEQLIKVNGDEEKLENYEVVVMTADKKKLEVVISPEGKISKVEDQTKEKKD